MMNVWTVISNHDLRRQKKTDDTGLLSISRHGPVTTHMNRILTRVRDGMSENMVYIGSTNVEDKLGHDITANVATMAKVKSSIMSP